MSYIEEVVRRCREILALPDGAQYGPDPADRMDYNEWGDVDRVRLIEKVLAEPAPERSPDQWLEEIYAAMFGSPYADINAQKVRDLLREWRLSQ